MEQSTIIDNLSKDIDDLKSLYEQSQREYSKQLL